jgi:hypothetical protein
MSPEMFGFVLFGLTLVCVIAVHKRLTARAKAANITEHEASTQEETEMSNLQEVAERAEDYHDAYLKVRDFVLENEIQDEKLTIYFLLMGVVWTATKRNEPITNEDAVIWLNLNEGDITGLTGVPNLPGMNEIPLEEFLDYLNKNHF